jgi:hypothetical protein
MSKGAARIKIFALSFGMGVVSGIVMAYGEARGRRADRDVFLTFAVARLFPGVKSNSMEPGWVPTKMGGAGAPDDIDKAHRTQAWRATSDEPAAIVFGKNFFHQKLRDPDPATKDIKGQDRLLDLCSKLSGINLVGATA